jgi:DUF4097 and DUF4098 domain-containing protein YvlB
MRPRASITGPLILIAIGALFLIHALRPEFHIGDMLAQYWPFVLIAWGAVALLEVCVLYMRGAPLPPNGVSGGGWLLVVLICIAGLISFEVHRPDTWWRRAGWEHGVEAFGDEHDYGVDSIQKPVGKAPQIVIETFRGDAKITAADGTEFTLTGHKTIRAFESNEADRANSATPVEVVVEGNTVTIRCNQDKASGRAAVTTDLELTVPKDASLRASGSLGDFDVTGLGGKVELSSDNAGVRLQDSGGDVSIDTRKSDLVRCTNVAGAVDLRGKGDDVELSKIAGQVTVAGEYSGTVSLRDLAKPARVENMHTQLDVQQVPGEVRLDRGSLDAENVVGPVKLNTHATDVTFDGFSGSLDVNVDKGDVNLRPGRLPLSSIAAHTHSGNMELTVPEGAAFSIIAVTNHGGIDNAFGDTLTEHTDGHGAKLEGSVGNGSPALKIATDRGSISINKASASSGAQGTISGTGTPHPGLQAAVAFLLQPR